MYIKINNGQKMAFCLKNTNNKPNIEKMVNIGSDSATGFKKRNGLCKIPNADFVAPGVKSPRNPKLWGYKILGNIAKIIKIKTIP